MGGKTEGYSQEGSSHGACGEAGSACPVPAPCQAAPLSWGMAFLPTQAEELIWQVDPARVARYR